MQDYHVELLAINEALAGFNKHLSEAYRLPLVDAAEGMKSGAIVKVIHRDWNAFPFPNNGTSGVYFIFGHERTAWEKRGLYVGKASFGAKTSDRLYAHLHRYRKEENFIFSGYGGEVYVVDYIASIDLDKPQISFMAPALEEYLITQISSRVRLLNGIGNKQGPNQAPEPTPLLVTDRADARSAPSKGVAHL